MVELIPKKQQQLPLPHWLDALFYVAAGFFILTIVGFVLINRLQGAADKDILETRAAIERERSPERRTLEASVKAYQKKINDFAALLSTHRETSKGLLQIEKIVHPRVWFSEVSLDAQKMTVKLSGHAESFTALGQQISILESNPLIKGISLSELSLSRDGEVRFALSFALDPGVFQ